MPLQRALLLALAVALWGGAAGAQQIGVVASVDPQMRGAPPGQAARTLSVGAQIVASETITTSQSGRGQILFLDQTTLTVSPNSEIVLDAFVYDPGGQGGSAGLRLTRGALRFIGGKSSRDREATIRTPTLIIGIRGSSALVTYENGRTRAILIAGDQLCAGTGDGRSCTNRQGGILTETGYAGQVSQTELTLVLRQVDGEPVRGSRFPQRAAGGEARQQDGNGDVRGLAGGATGIVGDTDPRGAPLSSRGEQRSFEVFDEAVRSEAVRSILSTQTAAPPPAEPAPAPASPPAPQPPAPQPPAPQPPAPQPPAPQQPAPQPPAPQPPAPELPAPEPPMPEPPMPEPPIPENPEGPFIIIEIE